MKWIHISDLHYNPGRDGKGDGRATRELRDKLSAYLKENNIRVDEMFITGDYRHALLQKDMDEKEAARASVNFIMKIAESIHLSKEHIHLVPGNHDFKREDTQRLSKIVHSYNVNDGRFSSETYPDQQNGKPVKSDQRFLLDRFSFFKHVSQCIYGETPSWTNTLLPLHHYRCFDDYSLLYLNTAIACGMDNERGSIVIGNFDLYDSLEKIQSISPGNPIIILAHHSSELFRNDELKTVERFFRNYPIKLYLCGDAHNVWFRSLGSLTEITMGCVKAAEGVKAAFSVGELNDGEIKSITAYSWDNEMGNWALYSHFNDEFRKNVIQYNRSKQDKDDIKTQKPLKSDSSTVVITNSERVVISTGDNTTQTNNFY